MYCNVILIVRCKEHDEKQVALTAENDKKIDQIVQYHKSISRITH